MSPYCIPGIKNIISEPIVIVTVTDIEAVVCNYFDVERSLLRTRTRKTPIPLCRHLIYWFSKKLVKPPPSLIEMGNRYCQDHTTVINGIMVVNYRIDYEYGFNKVVEDIETKIKMI